MNVNWAVCCSVFSIQHGKYLRVLLDSNGNDNEATKSLTMSVIIWTFVQFSSFFSLLNHNPIPVLPSHSSSHFFSRLIYYCVLIARIHFSRNSITDFQYSMLTLLLKGRICTRFTRFLRLISSCEFHIISNFDHKNGNMK